MRQRGAGYRLASEIARSAHLGALLATNPLVTAMIADAVMAGLCSSSVLMAKLDQTLVNATASYYATLGEVERVRADEFMRRARVAAEESWAKAVGGNAGVTPLIPRVLAEGLAPSMADVSF